MEEILKFLQSVGTKREAKKYLQLFSSIEPSKFALIKVSGECVENSLDDLCSGLAYLQKNHLYPVVIFGWGSRVSRLLDERGKKPKYSNGDRVTDAETLRIIRRVVNGFAADMHAGIKRMGGSIEDLTKEEIFHGRKTREKELGLVGEIQEVDTGPIINAIRKQNIPVVVPLCYTKRGVVLNTNGDTAGRETYLALDSEKYISLTPNGGILDENGQLLSTINIKQDYERLRHVFEELIRKGLMKDGRLKKLREAKAVLEKAGPQKSVQIATPKDLVYELFTEKGRGTKIILGYDIDVRLSMDEIDTQKLKGLIESRFGPLVQDFFTNPIYRPDKIIFERDYRGAILTQRFNGAYYMDKVVVAEGFDGNSLAAELLSCMFSEAKKDGCTTVFWRARKDNPFNMKYQEMIVEASCTSPMENGATADSKYIYYWMGAKKDPKEYVMFAARKPSSFER